MRPRTCRRIAVFASLTTGTCWIGLSSCTQLFQQNVGALLAPEVIQNGFLIATNSVLPLVQALLGFGF